MKNFVIAASLMLALGACATPHSKQVREDAHDRYDRANAQVVFDQANQSFHAGQFEAALGHIDKAIARYPKDGNYEVMRGRILLEMKPGKSLHSTGILPNCLLKASVVL